MPTGVCTLSTTRPPASEGVAPGWGRRRCSRTTPPHNTLLCFIWLFNFKPLADHRSAGSWSKLSFTSSQRQLRQKPAHVASLAEPRAARETEPGPPSAASPLSRALACCCRLRWCGGRAWSVGQRFNALTFLSLSRHVYPPHALRACRESFFSPLLPRLNRRPRGVAAADLSWLGNICPQPAGSGQHIRSGRVSAGTWLCC